MLSLHLIDFFALNLVAYIAVLLVSNLYNKFVFFFTQNLWLAIRKAALGLLKKVTSYAFQKFTGNLFSVFQQIKNCFFSNLGKNRT